MQDQVIELAQRGKALSPDERSRLVDLLLESLHEPATAEVDAAWDVEIERRLAEYDRGEVKSEYRRRRRLLKSAKHRAVIKPRFLPAAEAELLKEVAYCSKGREGLGIKFEAAVEVAVGKAVANSDGGVPSNKVPAVVS
jgi:putative addiction module component (TIGR02574 family)